MKAIKKYKRALRRVEKELERAGWDCTHPRYYQLIDKRNILTADIKTLSKGRRETT